MKNSELIQKEVEELQKIKLIEEIKEKRTPGYLKPNFIALISFLASIIFGGLQYTKHVNEQIKKQEDDYKKLISKEKEAYEMRVMQEKKMLNEKKAEIKELEQRNKDLIAQNEKASLDFQIKQASAEYRRISEVNKMLEKRNENIQSNSEELNQKVLAFEAEVSAYNKKIDQLSDDIEILESNKINQTLNLEKNRIIVLLRKDLTAEIFKIMDFMTSAKSVKVKKNLKIEIRGNVDRIYTLLDKEFQEVQYEKFTSEYWILKERLNAYLKDQKSLKRIFPFYNKKWLQAILLDIDKLSNNITAIHSEV